MCGTSGHPSRSTVQFNWFFQPFAFPEIEGNSGTAGKTQERTTLQVGRWLVGIGALVIAGLAFYVLIVAKPLSIDPDQKRKAKAAPSARTAPAMDQIDSESRDAMRDLLRKEDED